MQKAERVLGTPPLNTSALTATGAGLDWLDIKDDASPADIFRAIGRLRKEARDEIDRLIRFLDESDNHMELEPSLGWPERRNQTADEIEDGQIGMTDDREADDDGEPSLGSFDQIMNQGDSWRRDLWIFPEVDAEQDDTDDEPSLGSSGHYHGGPIEYLAYPTRAGREMVYDCEGDEHDGREPDVDHEEDPADDEPSLGWTIDGCIGNTSSAGCDVELGASLRARQNCTVIDGKVDVEVSYGRFLTGLKPAQREAMRGRMPADGGVSLKGREWGLP